MYLQNTVYAGLCAALVKLSTNMGLKGSLNIMFNLQQTLMFTFLLPQLICKILSKKGTHRLFPLAQQRTELNIPY